MENQFFNREKTNALKKSMRKDEIEKEMINEIFTRERLVYDNEKGKKIIVKEKINFSLNQSTKLREREFHERNKANIMEKSSKLLRLSDQRYAEKCTFQPTLMKKTKKKGKPSINLFSYVLINPLSCYRSFVYQIIQSPYLICERTDNDAYSDDDDEDNTGSPDPATAFLYRMTRDLDGRQRNKPDKFISDSELQIKMNMSRSHDVYR